MPVGVAEERHAAILFQQGLEEFVFKIKNGAFIRHSMNMGNGALIPRLGDQHAACVGVERIAEDIEQEVSFSYKADAEGFTVLWGRFFTAHTTALEIQYPVETGSIQGVDVGLHAVKLFNTPWAHKTDRRKIKITIEFAVYTRHGKHGRWKLA